MEKDAHELKKALGLFQATFFGIGLILGAGIYVVIGEVANISGGMAWLAVIISGLIALFTGFSYAELSSMYPYASSSYYYTKEALPKHKNIAFLVGWLLFFESASGAATASIGFTSYLLSLSGPTEFLPINLQIFLVAAGVITIFTIINYLGIEESSKLNVIFTLIEMSGLILIIILGMLFGHSGTNFFEPPASGMLGIINGAALFFFAYTGFELMATTSEETKNPRKTMPRALIIALISTSLLYLLVTISALLLATPQELTGGAPLAAAAENVIGYYGWYILAFIALFSTSNTILGFLISASRISYGMAKDKMLHSTLSEVHPKRKTPVKTILLAAVIALIEITIASMTAEVKVDGGVIKIGGVLSIVAMSANLGALIAFIFVNYAVVKLRQDKKEIQREFRIPAIKDIPITSVIAIILCITIIAISFHDLRVWIITLIVLIIGAIVRKK